MSKRIDRKTRRQTSPNKDVDDMSTFHGRFMTACRSIGVKDHNQLMAKWYDKYHEELDRQTVHRWFKESAKALEYKYLFKFADLTKYSARWIAIYQGPPQQWRPVSLEQQEVLEIHENIQDERRERWVQAGRDALTAQSAEKPNTLVPYPIPKT